MRNRKINHIFDLYSASLGFHAHPPPGDALVVPRAGTSRRKADVASGRDQEWAHNADNQDRGSNTLEECCNFTFQLFTPIVSRRGKLPSLDQVDGLVTGRKIPTSSGSFRSTPFLKPATTPGRVPEVAFRVAHALEKSPQETKVAYSIQRRFRLIFV